MQLTGRELLQKVKELSHLSRQETAKACGYYTTNGNGKVRVQLSKFYDAVISAKGISLDPEGKSKKGRDASYRVTVQKSGQIVIGAAYLEAMGLQPGDEFEIKLGNKHILLIQMEEEVQEAA